MSWKDKVYTWLPFVGAALLAWAAISYITRQKPTYEFFDRTNEARTQDMAESSYKQETNSVRPDGRFDAPPIQGMKSPFRVNAWDAYIP